MNTFVMVVAVLVALNFAVDAVSAAIIYRNRAVLLPRVRMLLRTFLGVDADVNALANRIAAGERQYDVDADEGGEEGEYDDLFETPADGCSGCTGCDDRVEVPVEPSTADKLAKMIQDKLAGKRVGVVEESKLIFEAFKALATRK